jgi:hypothetical protein
MVKRFTKPYPIYLLAVLLALFCGCGPALIPFDKNVPAQALSYIGAPPVHDARTRFRGFSVNCSIVTASNHA